MLRSTRASASVAGSASAAADGSDAAEKTLAVAVRSCRRSLAALCEHAFGAGELPAPGLLLGQTNLQQHHLQLICILHVVVWKVVWCRVHGGAFAGRFCKLSISRLNPPGVDSLQACACCAAGLINMPNSATCV